MKRSIRIFMICIITFGILSAANIIEIAPYPWLKVNYTGEAKVFNTSCEKLPYEDPFYHAQGDTSSYIKVMEYIPNEQEKDLYSILFSIGESGDCRYEFYLEGEFQTPAFILHTDHLNFLGNGIVIARGSMNEMFTRSQKYKISHAGIKELKQPFYAVDLQSEATKDFDIYMSKRLVKVIDHVGKGDKISVLATEFKDKYSYYLVRSELGLSGWIKCEKGLWVDETPIKDLYYHGD